MLFLSALLIFKLRIELTELVHAFQLCYAHGKMYEVCKYVGILISLPHLFATVAIDHKRHHTNERFDVNIITSLKRMHVCARGLILYADNFSVTRVLRERLMLGGDVLSTSLAYRTGVPSSASYVRQRSTGSNAVSG